MYCIECEKVLGKRQKKFCSTSCMNKHNARILREKLQIENPDAYKVCECCGQDLNVWKFSLLDKTDASKGHRDVCKKCSAAKRERDRNERTWKDDAVSMLLKNSRQRAKIAGLEHTLEREHIIIPTHCPVLGIELHLEDRKAKYAAPSIDRVDNSRGYTPDNIVIVSVRANILKRDATPRELQLLSEYYSHTGG